MAAAAAEAAAKDRIDAGGRREHQRGGQEIRRDGGENFATAIVAEGELGSVSRPSHGGAGSDGRRLSETGSLCEQPQHESITLIRQLAHSLGRPSGRPGWAFFLPSNKGDDQFDSRQAGPQNCLA